MLDTGEKATTKAHMDEPEPTDSPDNGRARWLRRWAAALGVVGTLLALSVPFLPVVHDQVDLRWPTAQGTRAVNAALTGDQPISLDATIPCATASSLGSGVLVATVPPGSTYAGQTGLSVAVNNGQVGVTDGSRKLVTTTLPAGGPGCALAVHSDGAATTVSVAGRTVFNEGGDLRPQVVGIYSDVVSGRDVTNGLSVDIKPDTRYQTAATALKVAVMALATLCLVGAIIALHGLDLKATGRRLRLAPRRWWRPTVLDVTVFAVLLVWWLIGAGTSDDGYILTMARDEAANGYIGNIYRWFNTPEAPFGWFYELYARWVKVSTLTPWTRLPALLMGTCSWLLISREALPRLGTAVRRSRAASWAAAGAFLAFWLPYDNGLRPESVVVLWTLLSMCLVERCIAAKRLLPGAGALFCAAFAVAATPTGLIALAPLLASARPLLALLNERFKRFGWIATLAPLTAAGTIVLLAVFSNQTIRSVLDSTQVREGIGPAESWYQETDRYEFLFSMAPDGSLERRFPVLLIILCLVTSLVVLLRRGKIPGAALGPSRRLIGTTILSFAVLALTPTKWTHHFGAFAAFGGSMAALTALATGASVLRSRRNRALFTAGLLIVTALAFTGPNSWFYYGNWGSPWTQIAPVIKGHKVGSLILVLAALALVVAGIEHLRGPQPPEAVVNRRRMLGFGSAPLAVVCALLVVAEVANFAKVIDKQGAGYSIGRDDAAQLVGRSCGVSDYTSVETNPLADILTTTGHASGTGYKFNGFPADSDVNANQRIWLPKFGSGPDEVPAWGNLGAASGSSLTTGWYPLPARAKNNDAMLVVDVYGTLGPNTSLTAEYGGQSAGASGGFAPGVSQSFSQPAVSGFPTVATPYWHELKLPLSAQAKQAGAVRLVATSKLTADSDSWLGVSAPRLPTLVNMTKMIGQSPTFVEWTSAQGYPCLRPFNTSDGISELPEYWYSAGESIQDAGAQWSGPDFGGPLGWIDAAQSARVLPSYLMSDLNRDVGTLYQLIPDEPNGLPASAAEQVTHVTHSGLYSPGANSKPETAPAEPPTNSGPGTAPVTLDNNS
ncbi:MAG TPA: arabinosyltransferase domain-containing protein [Pseudonocardiaceae bacterium]|nr:arabinosyltransferase domain-containing protein [Pseudonocardiaceae bacterium]